jgi:hypothetical protein
MWLATDEAAILELGDPATQHRAADAESGGHLVLSRTLVARDVTKDETPAVVETSRWVVAGQRRCAQQVVV